MKVVILGAGAMGCLYGAALHRAGCEVVLVDVNQPHIDAINANGLELETRAGTEHLPIPAQRPEELREPVDLVVVFTKTFHTDAALAGIAAAIGPAPGCSAAERARQRPPARARASKDRIPSARARALGPRRTGQVRSHGEGGSKLYPRSAPIRRSPASSARC